MSKRYDRDGCWENKAGALFFRTPEAGVSVERSSHHLYATGNGGYYPFQYQTPYLPGSINYSF